MSKTKSIPSSSSKTIRTNEHLSIPPNQTIYLKNIDSKIKKIELRKQLFSLFSTYGKILDVIVTRQNGMRGQAFICFEDLASSTSALRSLDGFSFYGQPLVINYAKSKSKASIVQEFGQEALFDPNFIGEKMKKKEKVTFSAAGAELQGRERKRAREEAGQRGERIGNDDEEEEEDEQEEEEEEQDKNQSEGQPDLKRRKSEAKANEEGDDSNDGDSMQMADSDEEE